MSELELMPWDSRILGVDVARISNTHMLPPPKELDCYHLIVTRLPIEWDKGREQYQEAGFDFVAIDFTMTAQAIKVTESQLASRAWSLLWISKSIPNFSIEGFIIGDSRFMLDSACRKRLPSNFWDNVIKNHCISYSDMVACAVDMSSHKLLGLVSCFRRERELELFLYAVHPDYQSLGIGRDLMEFVTHRAASEGLELKTQVLATNIRAMNFYFKNRFLVKSGEIIMHRWTTKC